MAEKPFPKQENKELIQEKIIPQIIEDEMKNAYIDYAMSVIIGRALPDARDGLKPVHRRILFAMNELGMQYNKPFKKSARIVGEVLGKYHPHGDTAVYDSLVRMAQDFSLRYPLINGQGNFGSIDGDNAAAMRYTEAKMSKIADELLADIEKETVDFVPNFDGSLREPLVLPSRIPNLLINGCSGIAVGMATNIPPHNIKEICDGLIMLIEKPNSTVMDLLEVIKGPDFPTAAEIAGRQGIIQAYTTGHGIIVIKAKLEVDERAGRKRIIIKEIPYQLNKSNLVEQIADLVKDKKITEIADIRDESDRQGIRIVIDLKKEANTEIVKNLLYANSRLQSSFSIILLALVNNEPKTLDLKSLMRYFLEHRKNIVTRKIKYELKKAEERCHILEGLIVALNNIDTVVELIKKSGNALIAKKELIEKFDLTETQSQSILDMKLQKLSILETKEIKNENTELQKKIREYNEILSNELKIWEIIKQELINIKKNFGDERKTVITDEETDFDIEDLVKDETVVV
ncbi:MAG: DNA topoisomerase (ATP-hydrolyzing), partial [Candidatus Woesearchaeota archaeon]